MSATLVRQEIKLTQKSHDACERNLGKSVVEIPTMKLDWKEDSQISIEAESHKVAVFLPSRLMSVYKTLRFY